ncbi:hypothetical protein [Pseudoneobacillus sp. C159]
MGLIHVIQQVRAGLYDDLVSGRNGEDSCRDCDGLGYYYDGFELSFINNFHKCDSCNGSGIC